MELQGNAGLNEEASVTPKVDPAKVDLGVVSPAGDSCVPAGVSVDLIRPKGGAAALGSARVEERSSLFLIRHGS